MQATMESVIETISELSSAKCNWSRRAAIVQEVQDNHGLLVKITSEFISTTKFADAAELLSLIPPHAIGRGETTVGGVCCTVEVSEDLENPNNPDLRLKAYGSWGMFVYKWAPVAKEWRLVQEL